MDSLGGYADIFLLNTLACGVVPQISAIMGPCAGGAVYSPAITDFVFMVEGTSYMFVTGPNVVKTVTNEEVTQEELGGAGAHAEKSGVCHVVARNDADCLLAHPRAARATSRRTARTAPPDRPTDDPADRADEALDTLVPENPNKPYDMHDVITRIVDDGQFFEIHADYAQNLIVGFAHLGGRCVGIVANQPAVLAGVLDLNASDQRARGSSASAMPSASRSSCSRTCPASCPAPTRSGAASSATAPSCSTPSARPPCPKSPSSRAKPTAAPTT